VILRYLPLVVKNSLRNRRRSLLTVLSIGASLCLLGVLMAMYWAFYYSEPSAESALRLITINRISLANPMPASYLQRIRAVPGVREVMIWQWFGGIYKDADFKNFFARFAVEPEKIFVTNPEYQVPDDQKKAFLNERTACLVGRPLAERFGWKLGDRVTVIGDIFPVTLEFTIRAIYDAPRDNENLMFHYDYLRESIAERRRDRVSSFVVLAGSAEAVPRIAREIDDMFRNAPDQTRTETERAFELSFLGYLGNVKVFLLAVCGAVTFTLLLVTGNTIAMSVRERVREIGILKTLGFTPASILGIILSESVAISIAGAALGLGVSVGLCEFIRRAPNMFVDLKALHVPPVVAGLGLMLAIAIGICSSAVPAWTASRRPIIECLRFTD
jgi:putative ABC transport system permease protein